MRKILLISLASLLVGCSNNSTVITELTNENILLSSQVGELNNQVSELNNEISSLSEYKSEVDTLNATVDSLNLELEQKKDLISELSLDEINVKYKMLSEEIEDYYEFEKTVNNLYKYTPEYEYESENEIGLIIYKMNLLTGEQSHFSRPRKLYQFKVANNDEYMALSYYADENNPYSWIQILNEGHEEVCRVNLSEVMDLGEEEYPWLFLPIDGFSRDNKYLWFGLGDDLARYETYCIEVSTGKLTFFEGYEDINEFQGTYPIER